LEDRGMLELNGRMAYIINAAAEDKNKVPIVNVLNDLKISKRTFYFELKKANEWLKYNDLGKVQVDRRQIALEAKNRKKLLSRLGEVRGYLLSAKERKTMEFFYIALASYPVTIEKMQALFDVSKSTILGDIKELKSEMKLNDIKVCNSIPKGYYFSGEEFSIRKVIRKEALTFTGRIPKAILMDMLQESMASISRKQEDYRFMIGEIIRTYENLLQTHLVQSDIGNVITMIMVACIRGNKGYEINMDIQEKEALANTPEYRAVQLLVQKLNGEHIKLSENETYYIAILILGIKNFDFKSLVSEKNFIAQITESLIENFTQITGFQFQNKDLLYSRLYLHIKPMYYRLKYGVHIFNPIIEKIKAMYPDIFEYTREAVKKTCTEISTLITDEEIAYLCIYMVSFLKEYQEKKQDKNGILIVCGAGVSTSVLIREQLQDFLGRMFSYELAPAGEIRENGIADYLLVISTVALSMEGENIIYTGPILEEKTKKQVIKILMKNNAFSDCVIPVQDAVQIMKKESIPFDESRMLLKFLQFYREK
jgi:mannitol operon transcriptional antiterminator